MPSRPPRPPGTDGKKKKSPKTPRPPNRLAQAEAYATLEDLLRNGVIVDTETTGIGEGTTIVEIAAVRLADLKLLYHSYVRPLHGFEREAAKTLEAGGLNLDMLKSAPRWPDVAPEFVQKVNGVLVAWNAEFDERAVRQSCTAHNLELELIPGSIAWLKYSPLGRPLYGFAPWTCAMRAYTKLTGRGWMLGLGKALEMAGIAFPGVPHTALGDCFAVGSLIHNVLGSGPPDPIAVYVGRAVREARLQPGVLDLYAPMLGAKASSLALAGHDSAGEIARSAANAGRRILIRREFEGRTEE